MNILIFVPQSRVILPSLNSIHALDVTGYQTTIVFEQSGDFASHRWTNVTLKYQRARDLFLAGDYDAMLTIEDDIIVPSNALRALDALQADIAYALTVTRHSNPEWSAGASIGSGDDYRAIKTEMQMDNAWGSVIDVVGCGLFCTLIRRSVLERLEFVLRGKRCCDFYFAQDAVKHGFTQKCDTRILCGHCSDDERDLVYWPDKQGYRVERDGLDFRTMRDVDIIDTTCPQCGYTHKKS